MKPSIFFNRDLSWLRFNERVLEEAGKAALPLVERLRFLSIYSSNLDEFYRVRMPVLAAMRDVSEERNALEILPDSRISAYDNAKKMVTGQQQQFGHILVDGIIPQLGSHGIHLWYNKPLPSFLQSPLQEYFFTCIAAYLEINFLDETDNFFPANNGLYLGVELDKPAGNRFAIVNIPSTEIARFYCMEYDGQQYIVFIDDIIRHHLHLLFPSAPVTGAYSIKITRNAELDLQDELEGDIAQKIEHQLTLRDLGTATRLLYQPGLPSHFLQAIIANFGLFNAAKMEGGNYHNLKDLATFPVLDKRFLYPARKPLSYPIANGESLFSRMKWRDILVHPPYSSYDPVLRFFNEAAIDPQVEEIYTTMYRVASDSRIVHALISAAKNGKKATVFVELKARFDEANNIKWAKRMKNAGVRIIYSIPNLKVHSKIALVKRTQGYRTESFGLLATGNLNESTARFYTDHILLTTDTGLTRELELVFMFLAKRKKPGTLDTIPFHHLLVSQFNLQSSFLNLIDREIHHARKGLPAGITIKLNNLEERTLINKLYEASSAGVTIHLIVRSICCLVPGIQGLSENITVRRIVDRYLEHGRVFIFHNNGQERMYLGSADWMNRNIYRRIEVCFPLYDPALQKQVKDLIHLQLADTAAAVMINAAMENIPFDTQPGDIRSQDAIYNLIQLGDDTSK